MKLSLTSRIVLCFAFLTSVVLTITDLLSYRGIDHAEALAPVSPFGHSMLFIGGLALFVTAALGLVLARTITRPLLSLHERMRRFGQPGVETPLPPPTGDEVTSLGREFDRMAARIDARTTELSTSNQALQVEIAQHQRAQDALHRQHAELRVLFDLVPALITVKDTENRVLRVNQRVATALGSSVDEIEGRPALELDPEGAARSHADDLEVIHSGIPKLGMLETDRGRDGAEVWTQTDKVPVRDDEGKVIGIVVMAQDITARQRAQEELRDAHAQLEQMVIHSPAVIYRLKLDGQSIVPLAVSANVTRLLNFTVAETLSYDWWYGQLHPQDRDRAVTSVSETIAKGGTTRTEYRLRHKEGDYRWVCDDRRLLRDAAGQPMEIVGVWTDITERKKVDETLRDSEERYRHLFEGTSDLIQSVSPDGRLIFVNRAWHEALGYTDADLVQRTIVDIIHPDAGDHFMLVMQRLAPGETVAIETALRAHDGRKIFVEGNAHCLSKDGASGATQAILHDVTERKRAEVAMADLHSRLVDASREAGMAIVATNVLHNVGNVLNSVNVSAERLLEQVTRLQPAGLAKVVALLNEHAHDLPDFLAHDRQGKELPGYLSALLEKLADPQKDMLSEVASLRDNIEHIREIVRMQQNYARVSSVLETIPLVDLVEDAIRINAASLTRHEVNLVRDYSPVAPFPIDKHKVLQILVNLLSNAKDALEATTVADSRLTVRVAMNGLSAVRVSVMDNGVGIAAEDRTRIFQHGFTTREKGHGFGLHSGALAAQELGGSLTAFSEGPGKGALFTLELPC
jgi:PAS domain S-box-containing protein